VCYNDLGPVCFVFDMCDSVCGVVMVGVADLTLGFMDLVCVRRWISFECIVGDCSLGLMLNGLL